MVRATTSLLIMALAGCPLLCGVGHGSARAGGKAAAHKCGCCQDESPRLGMRILVPRTVRPRAQAILASAFAAGRSSMMRGVHAVSFDWNWSLPITLGDSLVGQICEAQLHRALAAFWPDVGMSTGRSICCLYNTYLC